ncbi:MAG: hypothetical protein JST91_31280 [Actinobacteria bacterium]|nr:hypothetical protein [Actinomycetota bacterium]
MIALGLSGGFGHDAAACLVIDGRVVAMAEEERLSRRKHAEDELPLQATRFCLEQAGVHPSDVDEVTLSWDSQRDPTAATMRRVADAIESDDLFRAAGTRPTPVSHHLAHAASAFWPSGFDDAAVIVVDGNGEDVATSVWHGSADGLTPAYDLPSTQSLGHMYDAVVEYTGLGRRSAGKLMGLASYGDPATDEIDFPRVDLTEDGYRLDVPDLDHLPSRDRFIELRRFWRSVLQRTFGEPFSAEDWSRMALGEVPARHVRVAASAQRAINGCLARLAERWTEKLSTRNVALAGGVALNCTANGALGRTGIADALFIIPPAHDAGGALGAALWTAVAHGDSLVRSDPFSPFLGPLPQEAEAVEEAVRLGLSVTGSGDIASEAALRLERGEVIGWVQGRAEIGPRALGARSILAAPRLSGTRDRVNDVKGRERWRPLSPSVSASAAAEHFDGVVSPYMLMAVPAAASTVDVVPAVVHIDGSCRPQTVDGALGDPRYPSLLDEVERRSGVGIVLNTSFNLAGEPIVSSGRDAVDTFTRSRLDALVIGDAVITR